MKEQKDEELIALAKDGNAKAFEDLVNNHYDTMYRMAFKWCRDQKDAEDITQEACIKLARGIQSFKGDSAFSSWLYRLVINAGKDWFKKNNRHVASELPEMPSKEATNDEVLYAKQVLDAVHQLPGGEKDALLLVHSEGLSHKEAAQVLQCKESTISWRIHEARKKLSAQFERNNRYG